ncbi:MAG: hypothetical protein HFG20_06255 [Anaerotruncus sp.]|jgi:hypothetical protein|nr:hypothetical protein [Anaerotruncus sp.]
MSINSIGAYSAGLKGTAAVRTAQKTEQTAQDTAAASTEKVNQDTFEKTGSSTQVTYNRNTGKNQLNSEQVQALQNAETKRQESFVQMLKSMVVKQGQKSNLTLFGMDLFVTPEQSAKAAAAIGEGGEYSVDAVAGRIMDMAKALSGGDPSKIETLRKAVEKGFKAAGVELGGKLPSISQQTYTEVMKRFDDWANESSGATTTEKTN